MSTAGSGSMGTAASGTTATTYGERARAVGAGSAWRASLGQERHWAYQARFPESAAFNVPIAVLLRGPVDLDTLERALRAVVTRHESLRASFGESAGRLTARLHDPGDIPVLRHDLRPLSEAERIRSLREIGSREAARPFDLRAEPTTRVHLVSLAAEETVVVVNFHHIAFDGWSSPVFFEDLADRYGALLAGAPGGPAPDHRYVDFSVWQRRRIARGRHDAQLDHWRQVLADPPPPLPWPRDGRDPEAPWWAGDMAWLGLPQSLIQDAQQAARACGTSFFVLGLAVYQLALRRLTGCDHLAVGTPFAGRTDPRWADVVGFFVNTLVMPYVFRPDVPVGRLVEDTHRLVMAAHENQDLPYGVLLDELAPPVEPERTPYFQSMFILQNTPSPTRSFGSGTLATNKLVTGSARYDVTFSLGRRHGELALELENRPRLVGQETAIELARAFFGLLAAATADLTTPVGALEPAPVPLSVQRRGDLEPGIDGLFRGMIGDWRPAA
ncbi:condensation domain-containing protein [Streptomyces sp. NPDC001034]|uniref:condensation domain-containing protein n=1 Tax=Streptomyces sp. NPDC001034 TaxID=3154375 RepID=UPI00332BD5DA